MTMSSVQVAYDEAVKTLPPQDDTCVLRDLPHTTPAPRIKLFAGTTRQAPPRAGADLSAPLMMQTPNEREVGRLSRSGRQLSELEILQEKHEAEFRRVVPVVAQSLQDVVAQHESLIRNGAARNDRYATYETNAVPTIRIDDYVQRIAEYTYISPATLMASLVVLDRLSMKHPTLLFTKLNVYKLFFVAVRIASKVVDLRTLNNKNFASVGGISNRHLNEVEARMLVDLRFDLYIHPNDVLAYCQKAFGMTSFVHRSPQQHHHAGGGGNGVVGPSSSSPLANSSSSTSSTSSPPAAARVGGASGGSVVARPPEDAPNPHRTNIRRLSSSAPRQGSVGGASGN